MGLVVLPLHIWDRELDSRVLLSSLLAEDGHTVIFGHEYNISPLYQSHRNIFHFGAGRPIYNEPRTNKWYEPIVSNDGFNGLVFEEGLNDIDGASKNLFNGINERSVLSTTTIYAWTEREKELLVNSVSDSLKDRLREKVCVCGNTRIELLGRIGKTYYQNSENNLKELFGDFILISDNFGGIEMYGTKGQYDPRRDLEQRCGKEEVKRIMNSINDKIEISKKSRSKFCQVVNQLIVEYPHITFVLRPHPIADPDYWHKNIVKRRNVYIIYKDSIQPWINGSMMVIHAGCTVGVEAELSKNICIDISDVYKDQRKLGLSSQIAKLKPSNYNELKEAMEEAILASNNKKEEISGENKNLSTETIIENSLYSLNQEAVEKLRRLGHNLPNRSSLLKIREDANMFFQNKNYNRDQQINELKSISKIIGSAPPLAQKARYYTAKELERKLSDAQRTLNLKKNLKVIKLRRENVFAVL